MTEAAAPVAIAPDEALVAPAKPAATPAAAPAVAESGQPAQNLGDQAPPAKPEVTPEVVTPEQAAKREGRRFGRKLDKAYRERAEAQARAEFLQKQLDGKVQAAAPRIGEPKIEEFTDIAEFQTATRKFEREQAIKEVEANQRSQAAKREEEALVAEWEKQADLGSSKYDDFDEAVGNLVPTMPWSKAIMQAENAADVAYYLSKHREEAQRIMNSDPVAQIRAIGKLEAKLLAQSPEAKTPSQAPAPITPLAGKAGGASDLPLDSDDSKTWQLKENARMRKKSLSA